MLTISRLTPPRQMSRPLASQNARFSAATLLKSEHAASAGKELLPPESLSHWGSRMSLGLVKGLTIRNIDFNASTQPRPPFFHPDQYNAPPLFMEILWRAAQTSELLPILKVMKQAGAQLGANTRPFTVRAPGLQPHTDVYGGFINAAGVIASAAEAMPGQRIAALEFLKKEGMDLAVPNLKGNSPLHMAIYTLSTQQVFFNTQGIQDTRNLVAWFLENGVAQTPNEAGVSPAFIAAQYDAETLRLFFPQLTPYQAKAINGVLDWYNWRELKPLMESTTIDKSALLQGVVEVAQASPYNAPSARRQEWAQAFLRGLKGVFSFSGKAEPAPRPGIQQDIVAFLKASTGLDLPLSD